MKSSILALSFLLAGHLAIGQVQQKVTIRQATVFLNGAELASTTKINLPQGETDVLFTNIAGNVNQQSLTIGADNGVVVQSATFQNNYLNPADSLLSPRARSIKDSIEKLGDDRSLLANKKSVVDQQMTILRENNAVAGANTGLSVTELQKLLDIVGTRLNGYLSESDQLGKKIAKADERIRLLQSQLETERKKDFQPGGQLLVKFFAPHATSSNIALSYVVPNAGWTPSYDLRVDRINDPVKLFYKANVFQNSGVKWDNVRLVLSSGNPSESAEAPVLNPWYIAFQSVDYSSYSQGRVNNIQLNRYQQAYTAPREEKGKEFKFDSIQGAAASVDRYTSVDASGINTSFEIELPYNIPSDGQQHTVAVKTYELPATYRYYAVPKMDKDAFLQAQITNWEDLNLLPAATNVFYEGTYVGQGFIDMRNVRDTMNLSLGRDKRIIIRREKSKDFRAEKFIGSNVRKSFAYTISVRNTKKEPVDIIILEQFPVSSDKDIVVDDREAPEAEITEENGAVKWPLKLNGSETKKLQLSYSIKHPKDKAVTIR